MASVLKFRVVISLLMSGVSCLSPWARQDFPASLNIEKLCLIGKKSGSVVFVHCIYSVIDEAFTLQSNLKNLLIRPQGYKKISFSARLSMKFQILISKKISRNSAFAGSDQPRMLFFLLVNVKMPTGAF